MPTIQPRAPSAFLTRSYASDDWLAILIKSYETSDVSQRVVSLATLLSPRFQRWLRYRNLQHGNIYVSVNAITPGERTRRRSAIQTIRHIFLDADEDGPRVLADIAAHPDLPAPSIIINSSPGRLHVLWRVTGFTLDVAERLQKHLSRELKTDPAATPASQTTRLPGFLNHKRAGVLVTADYAASPAPYGPHDFPRLPSPPPAPSPPQRPVSSRPGRSPVERARRYVATLPSAVSGQHGDLRTFQVCCTLVRGFALEDAEALPILLDWNTRCEPPWREAELVDKLHRARQYGREPIGGRLETPRLPVGGR